MKDRAKHKEIMYSLLDCIVAKHSDNFILKGGTALMRCYGLDRFSEDIDFDGKRLSANIARTIRDFCNENNYSCNESKDTRLVRRFKIHYDNLNTNDDLLKIEVSYRQKQIPERLYQFKKGVYVYTIDELCLLKAQAYHGRDRLRDMYDLCFIYEHYSSFLSESTIRYVTEAMGEKGLEQLDYLVNDLGQHDKLIDEDKLADMFLSTMYKLGQLDDIPEQVNDGYGL